MNKHGSCPICGTPTEGRQIAGNVILSAAAVIVAVLFGLPSAAQAAPNPYRHCTPPIAGYLIRDTDHVSPDWHGAKFFPADGTWNFTAGQFVGQGGTYVIVKCVSQ